MTFLMTGMLVVQKITDVSHLLHREENMLTIRGIYNGNEIRPLEEIKAKPNVRVIITFLEDEPEILTDKKTEEFLSLSGTWEDDRSAEEIIQEIYESRTVGKEDIQL